MEKICLSEKKAKKKKLYLHNIYIFTVIFDRIYCTGGREVFVVVLKVLLGIKKEGRFDLCEHVTMK